MGGPHTDWVDFLFAAPGMPPKTAKLEITMSKCSMQRDRTAAAPSLLMSPPVEQKSPASAPCLYRLKQVLARIPVSKSSWFEGIKSGRYPRGLQLGPRTTVWRSDDIDRLIQSLEVVS